MEKFYFTFGSNPLFPFGENEYVVIEANDERTAHKIFRAVWPPRPGSECTNCAFCYPEDKWKDVYPRFYAGVDPSSFIRQGRNLVQDE